jgi:hypothetical protein
MANRSFTRLFDWLIGEDASEELIDTPDQPLEWKNDIPLEKQSPRVLLLVFNPIVKDDGTKLIEHMGWRDVDSLVRGYIADVSEISYGLMNYQIVERIDVDDFLPKQDGFRYDARTYLDVMARRTPAHQPDTCDYDYIIDNFKLIDRVMDDEIDEVWMFAFPYAGFYESRMIGRDAYWCNAPPLEREDCERRFVIMGFSYERGIGEMLEDLGHRTESIMDHIYKDFHGESNLYRKLYRYDKIAPGRAQVGWMHYAPNSRTDYDWGNKTVVMSACDDWLNFPNLTGEMKPVECSQWGNGDIRLHHKWWFKRIPHIAGSVDGIRANWWHYIQHFD